MTVERENLPEHLTGARSLNELMLLPGGGSFWESVGTGREMVFNLAPRSKSWKVLLQYLRERHAKGDLPWLRQ